MNVTLLSVLTGVVGMFCWGIYDFLGGVFAKQIGPFKSLFWSQLVGLISILLLAILLTVKPDISPWMMGLSLVAAIVYSAGYLFFFRGFEVGNVSIIAATMNLWAVFTMLFAFAFMGQRLTPSQTLGVVMIILGAAIVSINWNEVGRQQARLSLGVKEAIFGAFFFGIYWNISEVISEEIGWLLTTLFIKLGIVLFLLGFFLISNREVKLTGVKARTKAIVLLMGMIEAGAVAVVNYGLTIGDAILITPIASALSVVTITFAIIFLKDKITKFQGFGIALAVFGIVLAAF